MAYFTLVDPQSMVPASQPAQMWYGPFVPSARNVQGQMTGSAVPQIQMPTESVSVQAQMQPTTVPMQVQMPMSAVQMQTGAVQMQTGAVQMQTGAIQMQTGAVPMQVQMSNGVTMQVQMPRAGVPLQAQLPTGQCAPQPQFYYNVPQTAQQASMAPSKKQARRLKKARESSDDVFLPQMPGSSYQAIAMAMATASSKMTTRNMSFTSMESCSILDDVFPEPSQPLDPTAPSFTMRSGRETGQFFAVDDSTFGAVSDSSQTSSPPRVNHSTFLNHSAGETTSYGSSDVSPPRSTFSSRPLPGFGQTALLQSLAPEGARTFPLHISSSPRESDEDKENTFTRTPGHEKSRKRRGRKITASSAPKSPRFSENGVDEDLNQCDRILMHTRRDSVSVDGQASRRSTFMMILDGERAKQRKLLRPKHSPKMMCKFCKNNGEDPDVYTKHRLHYNEKTVCPLLRHYVCKLCNSTGDFAHTIKHCPFNDRKNKMAWKATFLV